MKQLASTITAILTFDSKPIAASVIHHLDCLLRFTNPNYSNVAVVMIVFQNHLLKSIIFVYNTVLLAKLWMPERAMFILGLAFEFDTETAIARRVRHHLEVLIRLFTEGVAGQKSCSTAADKEKFL